MSKAETVGLQAFLKGQAVGRERRNRAGHSREIAPEVPGSICSRNQFGIHWNWVTLDHKNKATANILVQVVTVTNKTLEHLMPSESILIDWLQ